MATDQYVVNIQPLVSVLSLIRQTYRSATSTLLAQFSCLTPGNQSLTPIPGNRLRNTKEPLN